jgi:hypothetical protein
MKKPHPDLEPLIVGKYLTELAYIRKFIKYWGTTTVNGHTVLIHRNYFFKTYRQRANFKRLAMLLKSWDQLKNPRMKGVKSAWLWLNPVKASTSGMTAGIVSSNLDKLMWDSTGSVPAGHSIQLELTVMGAIDPKIRQWEKPSVTPVVFTSPVSDQAGLIAEFAGRYSSMWNTERVTSGNPSDVYKDALTKYILGSTDVPYTIDRVVTTLVEVPGTIDRFIQDSLSLETVDVGILTKGYTAYITVPYTNFSATTDVVERIATDFNSSSTNSNVVDVRGSLASVVTSGNFISGPVYTPHPTSIDGSIWTVSDRKYYMKVSALTNGDVKLKDRIQLISSAIDSGYREKDSGSWKIVAFIVFVIVVIVTWGWGAKVGAGAYTAITALATAVTVATLVMSTATAALYSMGYEEAAMGFSKFLKGMNPLIQIAGIVSIVGSIYSAIGRTALEGGRTVAKSSIKAALEESATNVTTEVMSDMVNDVAIDLVEKEFNRMVWEGVKGNFTELLSSKVTDISSQQIIKMVGYVFDSYQKNELRSLASEIKDLKRDNAEYTREQTKVNDLLMNINVANFRPMQADWSIYAGQFDRPYERWATKFHSGNIQASTVSALRLADNS